MNGKESKPSYKFSQQMYIAEAGIEYLISILVSGSFLATLTKQLGISDSLTGIISSFISLGCLFQLLSIFLRPKKVKPFVIIMSIINQFLFMLLYLLPLLNVAPAIKIVLFVTTIFIAYIIYNFAHPEKINWLMSLVDDNRRGIFTANKEIISLIAGMVFSFLMGALVDRYAEKNDFKTAFILSAVVLFALMIFHTLTMILTVEKDVPTVKEKDSFKNSITTVFKNKDVLKVTLIFVVYYVSKDIIIPFLATYNINDLGFSLKFCSFIVILGSITRIIFSRFWGKYADKKSFAKMMEKCLFILGLSYVCIAFATPSNGAVMLILYNILNGVAMGGINSALINLIFDYVSPNMRANSLAICQSVAGVLGFLATLAVSPLVSYVQGNQNTVLGIPVYAQQILAVVATATTLLSVVYVRKVLIKAR